MDLFCALIDTPSVRRTTHTSSTKDEPFARETYMTSTSSFVGSFLLNKITIFPLKLSKLPSDLKLLLFTI